MTAEWPDMEQFWLDDIRRWGSPEADYGVHWRADGRDWPRWRVSYLADTGEVYAVAQHGSPLGPVRLLGVVPPDPVRDRRRETYYRTLESILAGWADPDVSGFDLAWAGGRLAGAGAALVRCRHCGKAITRRAGGWEDADGFPACVKGQVKPPATRPPWAAVLAGEESLFTARVPHEPMPAGLAGGAR